MRRRAPSSEPSAAPLPGQRPMFPDTTPAPIPPRVERVPQPIEGFSDGKTIAFAQCPRCGLKQSRGMVANGGGKCAGCDKPFDPDFVAEKVAPAAPAESPAPEGAKRRGRRGANEGRESYTAPFVREGEQQAPAAQRPAEEPEACDACGALLTVTTLGKFYPCGHGPGTNPSPPPLVGFPPKGDLHVHAAKGEPCALTVTWGEEKFSPVQFNSFGVGPFSITDSPRSGELAEDCFRRLYNQLAALAASTIAAKKAAFMRALKGLDE